MLNYQTLTGGGKSSFSSFAQGVKQFFFNILLILSSVATISLSSCQKFNDINERLDKVESEINELKDLQDAFNQAKVISSYSPITDDGTEGWSITFTDGTIIRIISEHLITSITEDEKTHVVTMVLADGSTFTFNTQYIIPSSIVLLNTKPIVLSTGAQASIEFRVNPSTAVFDYSEENCQIELDKAGTVQTKASYVTKPQNYKLVKIEQVVDEETQEVLTGQYRAVIEDTGRSAEYDEMVALVLNTKDAKGKDIQISSSVFEVIGKNFENLPHNGLPVVMINTPNAAPIVSKDDYVEGSYFTLLDADMAYNYQGGMKIKGRGNSTWGQPKKPYKMKFDDKVSLFNGPKDKEWVLLANYIDKSMLKTAFTYQMACDYGHFDFVPKFNFVDLVLNDGYNGTYQLGDQMKIGKGRALNGADGYLLETDNRAKTEADAVIFYSKKIAYPFNIKEMKVNGVEDVTASEQDANYVYIRDFVLNAEDVLYSDNWLDQENGYKKYLDMQSYVEWYLINEIGRNNDACFFSSCYMTLKMGDGEKLHMGPLWDFDLAYGGTTNSGNDQPEGFWIKRHGWWVRLFQDPAFVSAVKTQYDIYYAHKEDLLNSIDQYAASIEKSAIANNKLWGTLCANTSDDETTKQAFYAQVNNLKTWIATRMDWMKREYDAM